MYLLFALIKNGLHTGIGLHSDTQPTGGEFDDVVGVLTGREVLRAFKDNNHIPSYEVAVVNWVNEEGDRFPILIVVSSVWVSTSNLKYVFNIK